MRKLYMCNLSGKNSMILKRIFLGVWFSMCLQAAVAHAQSQRPKEMIDVGFIGGFGLVDQWGADANKELVVNMMPIEDKSKFRGGLDTGIYGLSSSYSFRKHLAVQLEAKRIGGGAKLTRTGSPDGKFRLSYLSIPVLLRAEFQPSDRLSVFGVVGPTFNFLIAAESENEFGDDTDVKDLLNVFDPGVTLGAGLAWEQLPGHQITVELRYGLGLRTVDASEMDADIIRNQSVSLLVGFRFKPWKASQGRTSRGETTSPRDSHDTECKCEPVDDVSENGAITHGAGSEGADPDGDGVMGDDDECPNAKEDKDGFQDEDGCPDLDNDGDGKPDTEDVCSDDRSRNADGCSYPHLMIEWSAFGTNGYRLKLRTEATGSGTTVHEYLYLAGPTELSLESKDVLEDIAALLVAESDIGICIVGHADGKKAEQWGLDRARTVQSIIKTKTGNSNVSGRIGIRSDGESALRFDTKDAEGGRLVYFEIVKDPGKKKADPCAAHVRGGLPTRSPSPLPAR